MRPVSVRLRAVVDLFSPIALGDLQLTNRNGVPAPWNEALGVVSP